MADLVVQAERCLIAYIHDTFVEKYKQDRLGFAKQKAMHDLELTDLTL
jgi:hypothetical protein